MSARIHAHVVGSRLHAVMLRDQIVRIARFFYEFFTAMARNKARNKNQALICSEPRANKASPYFLLRRHMNACLSQKVLVYVFEILL